jgi:hypothetical protein
MAIFGHYDENGKYIGFYDDKIHNPKNIPTENILEITNEQRNEALTNLYRVVNGVHTYVPYTQEELENQKINYLRFQRTMLLKDSDWVVLPYSPVTGSKLDEWIEYRQKLRDITQITGSILDVELPKKPE